MGATDQRTIEDLRAEIEDLRRALRIVRAAAHSALNVEPPDMRREGSPSLDP